MLQTTIKSYMLLFYSSMRSRPRQSPGMMSVLGPADGAHNELQEGTAFDIKILVNGKEIVKHHEMSKHRGQPQT